MTYCGRETADAGGGLYQIMILAKWEYVLLINQKYTRADKQLDYCDCEDFNRLNQQEYNYHFYGLVKSS